MQIENYAGIDQGEQTELLGGAESEDEFEDRLDEIAAESASSDLGHKVWRLTLESGRRLIVHRDGIEFRVFDGGKSIEDFVAGWDYADGESIEEMLASFGFDPRLDEADEDYEDTCMIWVEPNYYSGTLGAPTAGWQRDDDGERVVYANYADAKSYVDNYYNASTVYDGIKDCNILGHGQAGSDTLTICKA